MRVKNKNLVTSMSVELSKEVKKHFDMTLLMREESKSDVINFLLMYYVEHPTFMRDNEDD